MWKMCPDCNGKGSYDENIILQILYGENVDYINTKSRQYSWKLQCTLDVHDKQEENYPLSTSLVVVR